MKKVSIITVNYNQQKVTEELLASIIATNEYPAIEIIVVDNGSANNSVPNWIKTYPVAKFIRTNENLGFAGGNNIGIKAAIGDYVFFVNNDTEFTSGLIKTLVDTLESNTQIGMISPKIKYFDEPDLVQYIGFTPMNYYTAQNSSPGQFEKDDPSANRIGTTGFIHGAAMMIRKSAMEKAGLMAENFFLYYEEMDWCERFKQAGYEIWVNTFALIYHKESVSVGKNSGLKEYFMNRNRILFIRRNAGPIAKCFFYVYFICLVTPRNILKYTKEKNFGYISILFRAIWWNITHNKDSADLGYNFKNIQ